MIHPLKFFSLLLALLIGCLIDLHAVDTKKESVAPRRLSELPEKYQDAAKAVAAILVGEKEDPKELRATVEEGDGKLWIFQLWHVSAFEEMRNAKAKGYSVIGNPGGKCRNIAYDLKSGKASRSMLWQ